MTETFFRMRRVPVDSSSIGSVGYEPGTRMLEVEFRHGAVYVYSGVPPEVFAGFMAAESKGRYLNGHIRDIYECFKASR